MKISKALKKRPIVVTILTISLIVTLAVGLFILAELKKAREDVKNQPPVGDFWGNFGSPLIKKGP
jgi:hypothetical protein